MAPRISVIIPIYNLQDYLEECVSSVLGQTHPVHEVLLVDNCSTDHSVEIAHMLRDRHPEIIRVLHEARPGAPYARNLGLRESTGTVLQFLDGDDLLLPGKIEHQLPYFEEGTGFVTGPTIQRERDGTEFVKPLADDAWKGLFFSNGLMGYTSSILWSRQAVIDSGGWDTSRKAGQEYDLMFRILQSGHKAGFSDAPLTIRRIREGQISGQSYGPRLFEYIGLRHRMLLHMHTEDLITDQVMHDALMDRYLEQYTRLRRFAPRLAVRFRKTHFPELRSHQLLQRTTGIRGKLLKSDLRTLRVRCIHLLQGRYKLYLQEAL